MNINFAPVPQQPGGIVDPNEVIRRQELARALQQRSGGIQDIESPWQGLAQVSDAVFGGINAKSAADGAKQNNQFLAEALGPAMQGNLPPEKLNQIMALDPKLGMQLVERQQEQAKAAEAKAAEEAQKQQVSAALRAMGATQEADAFDAGIIPAAKAYELLIQGQEPPEAPPVVENYDPVTGRPVKQVWNAETGQYEAFGGPKAETGGMQITTNPDGTTTVSMGGKPLTEGQSKDAFYFIKGDGANQNLAANEQSLTNLKDTIVNGVPLIGNYFTPDGFKNANRDGKEFLAAVLRKESGGAITPDEWQYYGPMYLPAPGDGPDQLQQKREARDRAMDALRLTAGPGQVVISEYERQRDAKKAATAATPPAQPTQPTPEAAPPVEIMSDADYDALPSGATFKAPDGTIRKKP